ncbi:hypothetical protein AAMO2058_000765800 [Amorphochlora amoebiformis]
MEKNPPVSTLSVIEIKYRKDDERAPPNSTQDLRTCVIYAYMVGEIVYVVHIGKFIRKNQNLSICLLVSHISPRKRHRNGRYIPELSSIFDNGGNLDISIASSFEQQDSKRPKGGGKGLQILGVTLPIFTNCYRYISTCTCYKSYMFNCHGELFVKIETVTHPRALSMHRLVVGLLDGTGHPDGKIRGPAENKLREFEAKPGFRSCLLEIGMGRVPDAIRLAAFVKLKNSLRSSGFTGRSFTEEGVHLRRRLCTLALGDKGVLPKPIFRQASESISFLAATQSRGWEEILDHICGALESKTQRRRVHNAAIVCMEVFERLYDDVIGGEKVKILSGAIGPNVFRAWRLAIKNLFDGLRNPNERSAYLVELSECARALTDALVWTLVKGSAIESEREITPGSPTRRLLQSTRGECYNTIVEGLEILVSGLASLEKRERPLVEEIYRLAIQLIKLITEAHKKHACLFSRNVKKCARIFRDLSLSKVTYTEDEHVIELRSRGLHFLTELHMNYTDDERYISNVDSSFDSSTVKKYAQSCGPCFYHLTLNRTMLASIECINHLLENRPKSPSNVSKVMTMLAGVLLGLLPHASEIETQRLILRTLLAVIEQVKTDSHEDLVKTIQSRFGPLWKGFTSAGNSAMVAELLGVLEGLVLVLGARSRPLTESLLPILNQTLPALAPNVDNDIAKALVATVEYVITLPKLSNQVKRLTSKSDFLELEVSLQTLELFALIAPIDLFRPFFERVGVTIRKILASLCSTLYDLRSYLLTQRNAKALRSMFSSESPWMSTMQSALVTLESFVQIIEPPQAVEIFGPGVLLPVIKFMCEQMAKEITANQGRKKVTLQLKTAYLPEYDSHIRKVLTLFIRLTAVLVHKWGTNVVEILRKTGGPTAPSLVLNLWIHHYKKMDAKTQKLTLLAMGKLLEARVQIVCVKAMAIGQCCSANFRPDYSDENKTPLKKGLQFVRNARKLLNPRNFQDKKVRQYVGAKKNYIKKRIRDPMILDNSLVVLLFLVIVIKQTILNQINSGPGGFSFLPTKVDSTMTQEVHVEGLAGLL